MSSLGKIQHTAHQKSNYDKYSLVFVQELRVDFFNDPFVIFLVYQESWFSSSHDSDSYSEEAAPAEPVECQPQKIPS